MTDQASFIKRIMIIIIALVILGGIGAYYFRNVLHATHLPKSVVINTENQPTMGNNDAKIHIVAFEDLKCVNCARFNNNVFPVIKKKYIDTGKAKYTMINLAFISGSLPAANAARCIYAQNKQLFFPFVKYIYAHQPPENQDWANIPKLLNFASNIPGVNTDAFADCLVKSPYNDFINKNLKIASKLMHGNVATPTIYINGILVRPLSMERIETIIKAVS